MCTKIPICKEEYEKNIAETRERMNGQWRMKIIPRKSTGNF